MFTDYNTYIIRYADLYLVDGEHASGGRHDKYVTIVNVSDIIIINGNSNVYKNIV